jgi:hypothetical protein
MINSNLIIYGTKIRNTCQIHNFFHVEKSGIAYKNKKRIMAGTQYYNSTSIDISLCYQ